jgi:hypothetical protein
MPNDVVDPLVELGLIDPKLIDSEPGSNTETTTTEATTTDTTEADEVTQLRAKVTELEARVNAPTPAVSNLGGRSFDDDVRTLDNMAQQALNEALANPNVARNDEELKQGKIAPATVKALVTAEHGRLVAEQRSYWDRVVLAPAAAMAAAQKVAKDMSTPKVKIDPKDLLDPSNYPDGKPSVDGMRTLAHQQLNGKRDANFQTRVKAGADRVEGGAPGTVSRETIDKLDAFSKIKLGLIRTR